MSEQGRPRSTTSIREQRALFDELLRQGFSPEEADLALRDAGFPPPTAVEHPPAAPPAPWAAGPGYGAPGALPPVRANAADAGRASYLLGLLAWLPIPFVGAIVGGIAMAGAYPSQRRRSPLAGENARHAANWGLTYALGVVLSIVVTLATVLAAGPTEGADPADAPWHLWFLTPILVLGVMHLVVTILGLQRTSRGDLFQPPGVPFFRAGDLDPEVARVAEAARARATGAGTYAWGLLGLFPLVGASGVVAGLSMAAAYRWRRGTSPLATANGKVAANWGLTFASAAALLLVAMSVTGYLGSGGDGVVVVVLALVALHVLHLVVVVLGMQKASRGEVLRTPLAIPFLR